MAETLRQEHKNEIAVASGKEIYFYGGKDFLVDSKDPVLNIEARGNLKVYRDLERDAKVYAALQRRYDMVVNADTIINVGPRRTFKRAIDDKMRDMVEAQINAMGISFDTDSVFADAKFPTDFAGAQYGLLDAILMGFASAEVMWDVDGRETYIREIKIRDQKRFKVDQDHRWRLINLQDFLYGRKLPNRKFLMFTFGSFTDPYGLGLGNRLYWPVWFKRKGISFWIRFLDKYGGPTAVAKYPPATPVSGEGSQEKLLQAAAAINSESAIAIPEGQIIELLQAISTAAQQGFDQFERYIDAQIEDAVLGIGTGGDATTKKEGAKDQANHPHGERGVGKKDGTLLMNFLTDTLSRWIVDYNASSDDPAPRLVKRFPHYDALREQSAIDQILANQGFRRKLESVNELYGYGENVYENHEPTNAPVRPEREDNDEDDSQQETEEAQQLPSEN